VKPLDAHRIAEAALAISDERGADGLAMRAVAQRLGVTPMALYHHVADKAALVSLMVDASIAERPLPRPTGAGWVEDLLELARSWRESLDRHPALATLMRSYPRWTTATAVVAERWLSVWQQSELQGDDAAAAAILSQTAIVGAIEQQLVARQSAPADAAALDMLPELRAAHELEQRMDPDSSFDLLARAVIEGVHDRVAESGAPLKTTARSRASTRKR
jgi:AcrR family transcriptional regulator